MGHVRLHYVGFHVNSPVIVSATNTGYRQYSSWSGMEIVDSLADCLLAYWAILSCSPDLVLFVTRKFREAKAAVSF